MIWTDTLTAIIIFGVLLFPGLTYRIGRRHRDSPFKKPKAQEAITIVLSGLGSTVMTFTIFASIRWIFPNHTPDIGELLREPDGYITENTGYLFVWSLLLLLMSTTLAYFAGRHLYFSQRFENWVNNRQMPYSKYTARVERIRDYFFPFSNVESSSWDTFFKTIPRGIYQGNIIQTTTYIKCYLKDGSVIAGHLHSYRYDINEIEASAILLTEPIAYQNSSNDKPAILPNMRIAIVQGCEIKLMTAAFVHYTI